MFDFEAFLAACLASGDAPISLVHSASPLGGCELSVPPLSPPSGGKRSADGADGSDGESSRGTRTRSAKRCKAESSPSPSSPSTVAQQHATLDDLAAAAAVALRAEEVVTIDVNVSEDQKEEMIKINAYLEDYKSSEIKVTTKRVSLTHLKVTIHAVPGGHDSGVEPGYFPDGSRILLKELDSMPVAKREIIIPMVLDIDRDIRCEFDESTDELTIHLPYGGTDYDETEFFPAATKDGVVIDAGVVEPYEVPSELPSQPASGEVDLESTRSDSDYSYDEDAEGDVEGDDSGSDAGVPLA